MGHIVCLNEGESASETTGVGSFDAIQNYLQGHHTTDIRDVHVQRAWKIIHKTRIAIKLLQDANTHAFWMSSHGFGIFLVPSLRLS